MYLSGYLNIASPWPAANGSGNQKYVWNILPQRPKISTAVHEIKKNVTQSQINDSYSDTPIW